MGALGGSLGALGGSLGAFGASLGAPGRFLKVPWTSWGLFECSLGVLISPSPCRLLGRAATQIYQLLAFASVTAHQDKPPADLKVAFQDLKIGGAHTGVDFSIFRFSLCFGAARSCLAPDLRFPILLTFVLA